MIDLDKVYINNQGDRFVIEQYNGARDILVRFIDYPCVIKSYSHNVKNGSITNPFHPSTCGVGYVGNTTTKINGVKKRSYNVWHGMLERCYDNGCKSYRFYGANGVKVCDEWLCYETFEKWYNENYYEIVGEIMSLDKDILTKNNNAYSPTTCIFVPWSINSIMQNSRYKRKDDLLPIGVTKHKHEYRTQISINNVKKHLGMTSTIEEAFKLYKDAREQYIKQVADEYKDKIPQRLYDALYAYEVEITD